MCACWIGTSKTVNRLFFFAQNVREPELRKFHHAGVLLLDPSWPRRGHQLHSREPDPSVLVHRPVRSRHPERSKTLSRESTPAALLLRLPHVRPCILHSRLPTHLQVGLRDYQGLLLREHLVGVCEVPHGWRGGPRRSRPATMRYDTLLGGWYGSHVHQYAGWR